MAAVLGREFNVGVLRDALAIDENALIDALEAAESAHMIQTADGKGEVTFTFVHVLVPQVIRESIRVLRKRQMHENAASAIEKLNPENYENLAHHHSHAGNEGKALKYHTLAGERALKAFANQNAENHLLSALDLVEKDKQKADLLGQLGIVQSRQGKNRQAIETCRKAITIYQELKDYDQAATLYARAGRTFFEDGDTPGYLSTFEEGLEALKGAPESRGMAILVGEHARALYLNHQTEEGLRVSEKALKMAEKFGVAEVQANVLINMGTWGDYTIEESQHLLFRALELAEGANLWWESTRAHINLSGNLWLNGNISEALFHIKRAVELSRQAGDVSTEFFALSRFAFYNVHFSDFQAAEEGLERMRQLIDSMTDQESSEWLLSYNESILWVTRDRVIKLAIEKIRDGLVHYREVNEPQNIFLFGTLLARSLLEIDAYEEGIEIITNSIDISNESPWFVRFEQKCYLSIFLARSGDIRTARQIYNEAKNLCAQGKRISGSYFLRLSWAEATLLVAEEKWEQAWKAYQHYLDETVRLGYKSFHFRVLRDWAKAHLRRGEEEDKQRARELFEEAIKVSEELGANGWVTYLKEEMEKIQ